MSTSLRPAAINPIPWPGLARGVQPVSTQHFLNDVGTRVGSGSRGGGAAPSGSPGGQAGGDYKPGPQFPSTTGQPFTTQPGGKRRMGLGVVGAGGLFVPARDVSKGHQGSQGGTAGAGVYGPGQIGGPTQNPRQPYRANAGISVQVRSGPRPLPVHLAGGALSLGVPTQSSLAQQIGLLLAMRRSGKVPARPATPGSLSGSGIGTRGGAMIGIPFNRPSSAPPKGVRR